MDECINSLGDAKYMSTIYFNWGYWQIPLKSSDRYKTTFASHAGSYRFNFITFGLNNAPAIFQRAFYIFLAAYRFETFLVYLDDIIIFSTNSESHLKHDEHILAAIYSSNVTIKRKNCSFFTQKFRYPGHIIEPGQLSIYYISFKALNDSEQPRNKQ